MSKICAKIIQNWRGYKLMKKVIKNDRFWVVKKWHKNDQKLTSMGGVQNDKKTINFDLGDPDPQKQNFLKFRTFLQKLPPF
jgi:hypothetical protein